MFGWGIKQFCVKSFIKHLLMEQSSFLFLLKNHLASSMGKWSRAVRADFEIYGERKCDNRCLYKW